MTGRWFGAASVSLTMLLLGCSTTTTTDPDARAGDTRPSATALESEPVTPFPTEAFSSISDEPVPDDVATALDDALVATARGRGMTAVVMTPAGTWHGTAGKADGARDLRIEDQFGLGSINKSVVAAQVLQLVEEEELELDDLVDEHLPTDLGFDTNGATIRQLLSHRSGIPDYWTSEFEESLRTDPRRVWTTEDLLGSLPETRSPVDGVFGYSSTNYVLLGLVIEHVRGRPLIEVLRRGALDVPGTRRLVSQPEERPSPPMAMPFGRSDRILSRGGGYLPSTASVTSNGPGAVLAADAPSLAQWWRALCSGAIVTQRSLSEMAHFRGEYGLGLFSLPGGAVGHPGLDIGYSAWAGCLPDEGSVVVVLSNQVVDDVLGLAGPLVAAAVRG